ncbi:putative aldouronate transport system substrate-binding protein [Paenibacillus rhizosphaerae]|uniref:Putative aldouronate transport system substrate-binding protein n=1 Tax=Paenibacillus rhizosphaerae TaxID=297318 RepID=A0A839TNV5_9BACL|nr:extracellular solute-binding protein [Paenibacillus rhizosphaerae]MBB3126437.1 putative aldouronate transport system substrate-binding protein [Paenibacillus rhizosphaerae]
MSKARRLMTSMVALTVVFTMALSLAGCSGGKSETNGGSTAATSGSTDAKNTSSTGGGEAKPNPDEPGWKSDNAPITFDWYMNFSWFNKKWGGDATAEYVTKKTGVSINFIVPAGNENEKLNTMIASGKLPDFITLGWSEEAVKKMIEGKLVLPLNELADQYDPYFFKVADPAKLGWYTQPDGNIYGYPNASSSPEDYKKYGSNFTSNQTFEVRKDMYEAIGSPDMSTPEGFLNALKLAKEKFPEVNGQPLIPLGLHEFSETGNYSLEGYLQNFLAIPQQKDGKLYDRRLDPEYITWLKTFRKANEMGLLSKDIFIDKRPQMEEKIAQGRYFAMLYQRSDFDAQNMSLYQKDPNSAYMAINGPANSKKDAPTLSGPGISGWTLTLISKDVKDKKRAIEFLTYLISEEGNKDLFLGEKGVTYDNIDGKDQFLPDVVKLLNTDRTAFDQKYGASYTYWMLMDTNMNLQWAPPGVDPQKQMADWTKGKSISMSEFDNLDPPSTSEEGIAGSKNARNWGKLLPKLLLAKSDAEFDEMWNNYVEDRNKNKQDKIDAYRQKAYEENIKKLEALNK